MRTTLFFRRGIQTPLMEEIEHVCQSIYGTVASHASFGPGCFVQYAADGVSYQVGRRLVEIPAEMQANPPHKVQLQMIERDLDLPTGIFKRRETSLVCESSINTPTTGTQYITYVITVEGLDLETVNRLMDDFLRFGRMIAPEDIPTLPGQRIMDKNFKIKMLMGEVYRRMTAHRRPE